MPQVVDAFTEQYPQLAHMRSMSNIIRSPEFQSGLDQSHLASLSSAELGLPAGAPNPYAQKFAPPQVQPAMGAMAPAPAMSAAPVAPQVMPARRQPIPTGGKYTHSAFEFPAPQMQPPPQRVSVSAPPLVGIGGMANTPENRAAVKARAMQEQGPQLARERAQMDRRNAAINLSRQNAQARGRNAPPTVMTYDQMQIAVQQNEAAMERAAEMDADRRWYEHADYSHKLLMERNAAKGNGDDEPTDKELLGIYGMPKFYETRKYVDETDGKEKEGQFERHPTPDEVNDLLDQYREADKKRRGKGGAQAAAAPENAGSPMRFNPYMGQLQGAPMAEDIDDIEGWRKEFPDLTDEEIMQALGVGQ